MRSKRVASAKRRTTFGPSRHDLLEKYHARGKAKHSLWLCFSIRLKRDMVFRGDAEMLHHFWLESDPTITSVVYEPDSSITGIQGDDLKTTFDALVRFKDGRAALREVKSTWDDLAAGTGQHDSRTSEEKEREAVQLAAQTKIAGEVGLNYERITLTELKKHDQAISNWRRAVSFVSACRDTPLQSCVNDVLLVLRTDQSATLGELLAHFELSRQPDYAAAVFLAAQRGALVTNMDAAPLSKNTLLYLAGSEP